MTEDELSSLEKFIFSSEKTEALKSFPSTSEFQKYLSLSLQLPLADLEASLSSLYSEDLKSRLTLRNLLKQFDSTHDESLLKSINDQFLSLNFDYEAPRNIASEEIETFPSVFAPEKLDQFDLAGAGKNEKSFNELTESGKLLIDIRETSDTIFKKLLSTSDLWKYPNFSERFLSFYQKNRGFSETECFKKMSLSQLNEISTDPELWKNGSFVRAWMRKDWFWSVSSMTSSQKYEYFKMISQKFLESQNLPDAVKTVLTLNILILEKELGTPSETWFFKYLDYHRPSAWHIVEGKYDKSFSNYSQFILDNSLSEERLLDYFTKELLFKNLDLSEKFLHMFKGVYIVPIINKTKVLKGIPVEDKDFSLSDPVYKSVELEPLPSNPKEFLRSELISFSMSIKNIQRLIIRVLELNPKNYYLTQFKEISSNIELDGLVPSFEKTLEFSQSPSIRSIEKFDFPELSEKVGIFVIEFFGNGLKSRAIIKKGSLRYVAKETVAGHLVYILNENNEIVKTGGLYLDSRFFASDKEDGHISIPFCREARQKSLVLTDGEIYELVSNFWQLSESYSMNTAVLLDKEQLVARTTCKFYIKPSVYLNQIRVSSALLTACKAVITTTDVEANNSVKTFNDLEAPSGSSPIELVFEVPLNLTTVKVEFHSVVESVEGEKINLSNTQVFNINENLGNSEVKSSVFLTKINGEFVLQIKGVTGEPVVNQRVEIKPIFKHWNNKKTQKLQTDNKGQIYLGKMEDVERVSVEVRNLEVNDLYEWNLAVFSGEIQYPKEIKLCENDEFSLPVFLEKDLESSLWFFSTSEGSVIDNQLGKIKYDPEHSIIEFKDLEIGSYKLLFRNNVSVDIKVVEGVHLGQHFIIQENSAEVTQEDYMTIGISEIKQNSENLEVRVSGKFDEDSTVFALFFDYLDPEKLLIFNSLSSLFRSTPQKKFNFSGSNNIFLPSTALSEEYQYVLDRKKNPRFVGTTLDKPQILLKRLFLEDTKTEIQKARDGMMYDDMCMAKSCAMMANKMARSAPRGRLTRPGKLIPLDFLLNSAELACEKVINGVSTFKNDKKHLNVIVFAYNSVSCAYRHACLSDSIEIRDLRLKSSAKDMTEVYSSKAVFSSESFSLKDYSSSEIELFDSFSSIYRLVTTIAHKENPGLDLEFLSTLQDWQKLTYAKKKEAFDKFVSHELNLFLYRKDPKFFEDVVRPFLLCKMQKDFVDRYLCGDELKDLSDISDISSLNYLEMALLVDRIKESNKELAGSVVKFLRNKADVCKIEPKVRTSKIKAVLNSNSVDRPEVDYDSESSESDSYRGGGEKEEEDEDEGGERRRCVGGGGGEKFREASFKIETMSCSPKREDFKKKSDHMDNKLRKKMITNDFDLPSEKQLIQTRAAQPQYYKKLEQTKEFRETYYYKQLIRPDFSNPRVFAEVAESLLTCRPWLSESIIFENSTLTELAFSLSFISLEHRPTRPAISIIENEWLVQPVSNVLVFYKELGRANLNINPSIYIGCTYSQNESEVAQFIKENVYKCKYAITNTTSAYVSLTVLTQVPEGSIALKPVNPSKTHFLSVPPYTTKSLSIEFYFPYSGDFLHVPGNAALDGQICATIKENLIKVQDCYSAANLNSFKDLVVSGKKDLILEYLEKNNLEDGSKDFDIYSILWMMKSKSFWQSVLEIYRKNLLFNREIWSFAWYHLDTSAISEWLKIDGFLKEKIGYFFKSNLISTGRLGFSHTEFDPMVNARTYRLGENQRITNSRFKQVYLDYLKFLAEKPELEDSDLICLCQYFIYQERYQEAKEVYSKISLKPSFEKLEFSELQVQFDYLTCYLDLDSGKTIAPLYEDHPVPTWNKLFKEIRDLIQEISSEEVIVSASKNTEASLNFSILNDFLELNYENVEKCIIRVYEIDLEVLFSKTPFLIQNLQGFSYVKPNAQIELDLPSSHFTYSIEEFKGKNVLIEVDYKTRTICKPYFSNLLTVNVIERFGIIKVMDREHRPRPGAYVKAFARKTSGQVEFYKDGYTDVRGKFDYVSLNTDILNEVERFAVLVVDDQLGSLVQEANRPPQ